MHLAPLQVKKTVRTLVVESLMILVTQVPGVNYTVVVQPGLSVHDPDATVPLDTFIFVTMLMCR